MELTGVSRDAVLRLPLALSIPGQFRAQDPRPARSAAPAARAAAARRGCRWANASRPSASPCAAPANFRLAQDMSVAEPAGAHRQDGKIGRLLWEPLCLAALNTPIAQASAQVFLNVLRDSFSHARSDSDVVLPRMDLSSLFPLAAGEFLRKHGGKVVTAAEFAASSRTTRISPWTGKAAQKHFSHVICATAPQHALPLLSSLPQLAPAVRMLNDFDYQPIATIYLQYPPRHAPTRTDAGADGRICAVGVRSRLHARHTRLAGGGDQRGRGTSGLAGGATGRQSSSRNCSRLLPCRRRSGTR